MEKYPDYETYQALYARYYHGRDAAELLKFLEPISGKRVLDLCGGDGRLTLKALEAGVRHVTLVDSESTMVPSALYRHKKVCVMIEQVRFAFPILMAQSRQFDCVVCQQAVNYWLDKGTAKQVADVLVAGGIFAFNTFNQKPPEKPRVLQYELDGHAFVEVSWLIDDEVHHLQVRNGLVPHHTVFQWLSPEQFRELLEPHFVVVEERQEKTSLYRCEKK